MQNAILTANIMNTNIKIEYKDIKDFAEKELEDLFLSVEWSSGHFPEKLVVAMKNFKTVYSAWDGNKLVGMICAMDDGIMNAYVHYLLVNPEYHGKTIGRTLVEMMKQHYKDYLRIAVIAYDNEAHFYENCGFKKSTDAPYVHYIPVDLESNLIPRIHISELRSHDFFHLIENRKTSAMAGCKMSLVGFEAVCNF